MKYRVKSAPVTASQWFKNGDHPNDFDEEKVGFEGGELRTWTGAEVKALGWEGQVVRYFRDPTIPGDTKCSKCGSIFHSHGWMDKPGIIVCPGYWIINPPESTKNHPYTLSPEEFEKIFEPAE